MSNLIDRDELYKALSAWDWQELYLPVHFKELVDDIPTIKCDYTELDVQAKYDDGFSMGVRRGYEDAVRNYRHLILKQWIKADEKPLKAGQYLCTLVDEEGTYLDIVYWNDTFGGRWQSVFEGEDSYSDIGNVVAWMPMPDFSEEI